MKIDLRPALKILAKLTGKRGSFAADAVALSVDPSGAQTFKATNANTAAIYSQRGEAAGDSLEALIAWADWKKGLAGVGKSVALTIDGESLTFASTDGSQERTYRASTRAGRFPPIESIFPSGEPLATVRVDPGELVALLDASAKLVKDMIGYAAPIDLKFYGPGEHLEIVAAGDGMSFRGLIFNHDRKQQGEATVNDRPEE